jgi:hypothetical protein
MPRTSLMMRVAVRPRKSCGKGKYGGNSVGRGYRTQGADKIVGASVAHDSDTSTAQRELRQSERANGHADRKTRVTAQWLSTGDMVSSTRRERFERSSILQ